MWRNKVFLLMPLVLAASAQPAQAAPAAPEAVGDVQLVAANDYGPLLSHTIRYADGNWQPFGQLQNTENNPGISGLTSSILNGEEHVFYQSVSSKPFRSPQSHYIRHVDGSWNLKAPMPDSTLEASPKPGTAMGVANVNGVLHLLRLMVHDEHSDLVRHSAQNADGTWSPWETVPITGTSLSTFNSLSVTGNGSDLRLMLSTTDGTALVETDRHADGTWSPARQTSLNTDAGVSKAVSLSVSQVGEDLEVVALSDRSEVYHSIMHTNGSWDLFRNVAGPAGYPGQVISIATAASRGELQLVVGSYYGGLMHTIRHADGSWQTFGNVRQAAGNPVGVSMVTLAGQ